MFYRGLQKMTIIKIWWRRRRVMHTIAMMMNQLVNYKFDYKHSLSIFQRSFFVNFRFHLFIYFMKHPTAQVPITGFKGSWKALNFKHLYSHSQIKIKEKGSEEEKKQEKEARFRWWRGRGKWWGRFWRQGTRLHLGGLKVWCHIKQYWWFIKNSASWNWAHITNGLC